MGLKRLTVRMEMLAEAMATLDSHVDRLDSTPYNRQDLVDLAGGVRKSLEGMSDMLMLYNWIDEPPASAFGNTPLMSP